MLSWDTTILTYITADVTQTDIHINEKVTRSAASIPLSVRAPAPLPHSNQVVAQLEASGLCGRICVDNGEKTANGVDEQPAHRDRTRFAAMSTPFPKSDSTTSLLKSSSAARRPTHLPEHTAESQRSQHHHQHHHQHHNQRPAALLSSSSSKAEESFWSAECDVSARRPLCHPSLVGSQDSSNNAATRGKCKSHAPHSQVSAPPEPNGDAGRSVRERSRTSKHRHHHRRKHNRDERPAAAGPDEPEHPRRCHTHSRAVPRVPSLSDSNDDRVPLCEPRDRNGASAANSGGQVSSPSPSSYSLVPLSSRSSRRSRRSSAASSASDINLRTILNSLFGQVRP